MSQYSQTIEQLHALVEDGIVPGVSYVIFDGQKKVSEVFGHSQLIPTVQPLWHGAQYDVASLTKVIGTTTLIMKLIQAGKLSADDYIQDYLPDFGDSQVTVRNLLTHTSGITGYIPNRNHLLPADLTKALLGLTVGDDFNQHVKYADIGFIYLGWIIEAFYHQPVQTVISQQILQPLQMSHSTFRPVAANCVPTEIQKERGLIRGVVHDPKAYILREHCGCAGLFSTLDDLETFSHAFVENNLNGMLSDETMSQLFQDQTPMDGYHGRTFGWRVLKSGAADDHMVVYHTGFTGTWMVLDKFTKQGFIMLSNRVHPSADNDEFLKRRHQLINTYLTDKIY
ncbi:serine hydrolase domain-containing protein [Paucilactobacillus suebicus]|uniref:Beta-lactamase n=1 Tax=Paucilactobacillus suebicus DSM 5007 = KCTC 3549 TaxID=1423807 RepID=A0A0R1W7G4_9LACO|nr:serine hydrolase domain-containing protein [Paucilactobacillus suebicus]KRM13533.1 beta-lactamase [Paucilactobacillus suebicus DSM 5007 = KCTC 3549]